MFLIDTFLDKSKIHGVGVFSKENINKGIKIKEERPEFEMEFNKNKLPSMPLALAKLIDTYLDKSKIHGVGVFSKENIKKGRKIKEERPEFEMEFNKNIFKPFL